MVCGAAARGTFLTAWAGAGACRCAAAGWAAAALAGCRPALRRAARGFTARLFFGFARSAFGAFMPGNSGCIINGAGSASVGSCCVAASPSGAKYPADSAVRPTRPIARRLRPRAKTIRCRRERLIMRSLHLASLRSVSAALPNPWREGVEAKLVADSKPSQAKLRKKIANRTHDRLARVVPLRYARAGAWLQPNSHGALRARRPPAGVGSLRRQRQCQRLDPPPPSARAEPAR